MITHRWMALACAGFLGIGAAMSTPATTQVHAAYEKVDGAYRMLDETAINGVMARGIDLSHWKGTVDWDAVAADDISFVMLGTTYSGGVDPKFTTNATEAAKAGLNVGAYLYSYATTPQMASNEADFILGLIKDYPISYPVAFDAESSALGALSPQEISTIINTFCKKIEDAGYHPMVYANDYWLANKIDLSQMKYDVWVARYELKHTFANPVMWQATQTGAIAGVNGNVDINFQYTDLSSRLPANRWRTIGDKTYYYQNYVMQKNAWIDDGTGWFHIGDDAQAEKGWKKLDGSFYYLDNTSGRMAAGWLVQDNRTYHLGTSGAMAVGWTDVDGARYFFDENGAMQTGWHIAEDDEFYLIPDSGKLAVDWCQIDNSWYYFDGQGKKQTGMVTLDGAMYYLAPGTGIMAANTTMNVDGVDYQIAQNGVCTQIAPAETAAPGEMAAPTETAMPEETGAIEAIPRGPGAH